MENVQNEDFYKKRMGETIAELRERLALSAPRGFWELEEEDGQITCHAHGEYCRLQGVLRIKPSLLRATLVNAESRDASIVPNIFFLERIKTDEGMFRVVVAEVHPFMFVWRHVCGLFYEEEDEEAGDIFFCTIDGKHPTVGVRPKWTNANGAAYITMKAVGLDWVGFLIVARSDVCTGKRLAQLIKARLLSIEKTLNKK